MKKNLFWILSFLIALFFAVFQRLTGPSYPVKGKVYASDGKAVIHYMLPRSCTMGAADCRLDVWTEVLPGGPAVPVFKWKRYKTADNWAELPFSAGHTLKGIEYEAVLPDQPPAGKLEYTASLKTHSEEITLGGGSVVARFKGAVPGWILVPHIVLMFLFMVFSARIFLTVFTGDIVIKHAVAMNFVFLLLGGFVFGPLTQYHAFGQYWTGWPLGQDLTDTKILPMLVFWAAALWAAFKAKNPRPWFIAAFAVTVLVYFVPHSMFGSELDYSTGAVVTGK